MSHTTYPQLKALILNCSLKPSSSGSHTQKLIDKVAGVMRAAEVSVETVHVRDYEVHFGMVKDAVKEGTAERDDWPQLQKKIKYADILIIGSPIWLGVKSSVATLVIERMYAWSSDKNEKDQYLYYGKVGGCIVTGNEDGVKHVSSDVLYALQHIGFTIPPQADCGWIGEVGPGKSYGDQPDGDGLPTGYDNDFTNKNATTMAWNLMHIAALLKQHGGLPAEGNVVDKWKDVPHVSPQRD